ncbi:MAG: serine/threonine-protein phosphatase [Candidatus Eremiobacteraeota bacterium]|nr:serine/threonine-protein phosphatase [Candidatus Eremiobacteraeota bacterium]
MADTLQRAFLPQQMPRLEAGRCDAAYRPGASEAMIGGDWYDAFVLPDERVALAIGDVAGHGLAAAIIMGEVRFAMRAAAVNATKPAEVLERVNQVLMARAIPTMVTALFGIYDPKVATFTYASAGHPAPLLATGDGRCRTLPTEGIALGIVDRVDAKEWTFSLPPGALLVLYTDGLVEYDRDPIEGEERLREAAGLEALEPSPDPATSLQARILGERDSTDDVATLTLATSRTVPEKFIYTVSAIPLAAPLVRHALACWVAQSALAEVKTYAVISAVGEAVANAIEHAYSGDGDGVLIVTAERDEASLRLEIQDFGRWRPRQRREDRGRGLPLMRALTDGLEIRSNHAHTSVRMRIGID